MHGPVGGNDTEHTGVLVQDDHVIAVLHDLRLIRNAEALGSHQRHAVGGPAGVGRSTCHAILLGARLQLGSRGNRGGSSGRSSAPSSSSTRAAEIVHTGK